MSSPSIIFKLHEVQMFSSNVFCVNIGLIYWQKILQTILMPTFSQMQFQMSQQILLQLFHIFAFPPLRFKILKYFSFPQYVKTKSLAKLSTIFRQIFCNISESWNFSFWSDLLNIWLLICTVLYFFSRFCLLISHFFRKNDAKTFKCTILKLQWKWKNKNLQLQFSVFSFLFSHKS